LTVGLRGHGTLAVTGGTVTTTGASVIGSGASGSGTATVTGGGVWNTAKALTVGSAGSGTLAIGSGSSVSAGSVAVGKLGGIALSGGALSAASVTLNAGATLSGNGLVTGSVVDNGTINAAGGLLTLSGSVSGIGSLTIGNSATLEVGATAAGNSISFLGTTGILLVDQPGTVAASITGYGGGNMIDLAALHFAAGATASVAGGVVTVQSGALTEILHVTGIANGSTFSVTADAAGTGTLIGLPGGTAAGYPIPAGVGHDIMDDFRSNPVVGMDRLQIGDHDGSAAGMFDHSVAVAASAAAGHFGIDTPHLMSAANGSDFRLA
jgi:fibronectin-binding autotransporter adhesin